MKIVQKNASPQPSPPDSYREETELKKSEVKVLSPDSYRGGEDPIAIGLGEAKLSGEPLSKRH